MEGNIKAIVEKISSYNIFNNLFPGAIFCYTLNKITRFTFFSDNIIEQLFIWYFAGIIMSRIGSVFIETALKKLIIKKKPYIIFSDYKQYCVASEAKPFIATLSEVNNTYRTMIAVCLTLTVIYIYDIFFFDLITNLVSVGNEIAIICLGLLLTLLFMKSYKKQTNYIKNQVDNYVNDTDSKE